MKNIWVLLLLTLLMACNGTRLDRVFKSYSPYEKYVRNLTASSLKNSALVKSWIAAGEDALLDSITISLPYQELGYFDPADPKAFMLRFPVFEGQQLEITLSPVSEPGAIFYMDLYEVREDGNLCRRSSSEENHHISETIRRNGVHAIRIQPEILRGGVFDLKINFTGSLAFPIPEKTSRDVSSFFGDVREGGRRKHEGLDIFAPRGAPVVAVEDGLVSRVGTNRLGGKTVSFFSDNYSYYYAHLDSQLVNRGQRIKAGDTLGLVGNTGNAISTAPHLHFGIYAAGKRSVDPINFFRNSSSFTNLDLGDSIMIGLLGRVKGKLANLRQSPTTSSPTLAQLPSNTVLQIEGKIRNWYRIRLPHRQQGFIAAELVESAEIPLENIPLNGQDLFKSSWNQPLYQSEFEIGTGELLGEFQSFNLIRTSHGRYIWHQPALKTEARL